MPIKYPDKVFYKEGNKHEEYYSNNAIDTYFITSRTNKRIIKSGYCGKDILFSKTVTYYNRFEQAYKVNQWVANLYESDHFAKNLIPHFALFGDMVLIEHDYEEEEKEYPEFKIKFN